jgi:hypothetical protein
VQRPQDNVVRSSTIKFCCSFLIGEEGDLLPVLCIFLKPLQRFVGRRLVILWPEHTTVGAVLWICGVLNKYY